MGKSSNRNKRTLLLNSDWSPLTFITDRRAMALIFKEKAEVVAGMDGVSTGYWEDAFIRSPSVSYKVPATLRMLYRTPANREPLNFSKKLLFHRDDHTCQYCHQQFSAKHLTIDHVVPKSKGGRTSWENCVAACERCNRRKDNASVEEAGLRLLKKPVKPNRIFLMAVRDEWHLSWTTFLKQR